MADPRPRHFSMLRDFTLADLITLGNGSTGVASIFAILEYLVSGEKRMLWIAFGMLPFSAAFDFLDGRVARWRDKASPLGLHLDSLADVISFGVAPAVLGYGIGFRGAIDAVILIYFVVCGLSRLARYNATAAELSAGSDKVPYFEGTPIPTSLLIVAALAVLCWQERILNQLPFGSIRILGASFHPLVLIYAVSGSAMISKTLHIPKI